MQILEDYLCLCLAKASENTRLSYRRDLSSLASYYGQVLLSLSRDEIKEYLAYRNTECSSATMRRMLSVFRSFFSYLKRIGLREDDPTEGILLTAYSGVRPTVLTTQQFLMLIDVHTVGIRGERDRAMLLLLYYTGIKVSELVSLKRSDFSSEEGSFFCGKGTHRRCLCLPAEVTAALKRYLSLAELQREGKDAPLFLNGSGGFLTRQAFWKILRERADRAGLPNGITPQSLRFSFSERLLSDGVERQTVRELLGNTAIGQLGKSRNIV